MKRFGLLVAIVALLPFAFSAPAFGAKPLTTLTFDELSLQPVDGLSFSGVRFGFQIGGVPSTDAHYHAFGPGTITFVQDPSLEGNSSGALTLSFDRPTTVLEFGIARSCICTLSPGVSVELFKPGAADLSRGVMSMTTLPVTVFSEAQFSYSGAAIQTAVITFPSVDVASRFALDNLTFQQVGA